jgi:hypothetical protein
MGMRASLVQQALRPSFALLLVASLAAAGVAACGGDEDSSFGQGATYTVQDAAAQPPLPPGAGPYDGGPVAPRDSGPAPVDATVTDTGASDTGATDAGPKDASADG